MRRYLIFLIFIAFSLHAAASGNKFSIVNNTIIIPALSKSGSIQSINQNNAIQFQINQTEARQAFLSKLPYVTITDFPISRSMSGNLKLRPARSVTDANTLWLRNDDSGIHEFKGPELVSFIGEIEGKPDSKVYLNYIENQLYCIISDNGNTYEISPASGSGFASLINDVYTSSPVDWSEFMKDINNYCGTPDPDKQFSEIKDFKYNKDQIQSTVLLSVPLAAEGEYYYYELLGKDLMRASAYMANVIALSARIYEENANITFTLPYVLINETQSACPYANSPTLANKLYKMPQAWSSRSQSRAVGVLFANLGKQPAGNIVAGISFGGDPYRGSLCSKSYSYCVLGIRGNYKYPTTNYTWDVNVATHEIGHNFGLPHTHGCFWYPNMIDTCITASLPYESDGCVETGQPIPRFGTIMSYCHLTNSTHSVELKFHDREKPLLRQATEKALCVSQPSGPIVKLLNPLGGKELKAGQIEKIRWTQSKVNFVTLEYSDDSAKTWVVIAEKLKSTDTIYNWTLPNIMSQDVFVCIHDFYNPSVADTSIVSFSIIKPFISLLNPQGQEKYGQMDKLTINWNKTLVDQVIIEFSSDGGSKWDLVAKDLKNTIYDWEIPDIVSQNCLIRVKDQANNEIISQSGLFAIGKETAEILEPKGGEDWCIGEKYNIKWESDYLSKIYLEYSTDDGATWKKIRMYSIDASLKSFEWKIPDKQSDNVIIRLTSASNSSLPLAFTKGPVKFDSCQTSVNYTQDNLDILDVSPNPADNMLNIKIQSGLEDPAKIQLGIADITGRVWNLAVSYYTLTPGMNYISSEVSNLPQGNYFIIFKYNGMTKLYPLRIIR